MHVLIVGGLPAERATEAARRLAGSGRVAVALDTAMLPFVRPSRALLPSSHAAIVFENVERAFPDRQSSGTRLVLTQSTYVMQKWLDLLEPDESIVATGDTAALRRDAPEALQRRGPWTAFDIVDLDVEAGVAAARPPEIVLPPVSGRRDLVVDLLIRAYSASSADERLALCRQAVAGAAHSAVAALSLASACREQQDVAGARAALDTATRLAPEWEAAWYEEGKLWLGLDDMERAAEAFRRAATLMPSFAAAWSNLGATLGELDRPEEALAAFRQALAHDPAGVSIVNNIGVVSRELGRLDESETAFRRVVQDAPDFVFGHYNLGHTLFLAGRYADALAAYEEGQRRDPEKNRRQGCRLALVRFANRDLAGARREFWRFANAATGDEREDLLLEACEIAAALVGRDASLDPDHAFVTELARELG